MNLDHGELSGTVMAELRIRLTRLYPRAPDFLGVPQGPHDDLIQMDLLHSCEVKFMSVYNMLIYINIFNNHLITIL